MFSQIKVKRKPQINDTDTKNEYANVINSIYMEFKTQNNWKT